MPGNSTQNETATCVTPMAAGGFGLAGIFFYPFFISWAIRVYAREARRNNPQRVLTDQYFDDLEKLERADKKKRRLWRRLLRRLHQGAWSLIKRATGGHWPRRSSPTGDDQVDPPVSPRLLLLVEASGDSASMAELQAANANSRVEFVFLPRGYRLLRQPKDATSMGRILEALKMKGSDK